MPPVLTPRRHLDILERLARGVDAHLAIQLHGATIHSSWHLTAVLLDGHDPAYLGAYPDPGNQAVRPARTPQSRSLRT
jgi:hypothetical protein